MLCKRYNMSISKYVTLAILATCILFSQGCEYSDDPSTSTIDPNDKAYVTFGKVFPVKDYSPLDLTNPHEVTAYSIWKCSQGRTVELLSQISHVEEEEEYGKSFVSYVEMFGPDLVQYINTPLAIKFEGYRLDDDTSVWYYKLTNPSGIPLQHQPWVSSHRSRTTGNCALTGIFLYDPNEEDNFNSIPDNIVRAVKSE